MAPAQAILPLVLISEGQPGGVMQLFELRSEPPPSMSVTQMGGMVLLEFGLTDTGDSTSRARPPPSLPADEVVRTMWDWRHASLTDPLPGLRRVVVTGNRGTDGSIPGLSSGVARGRAADMGDQTDIDEEQMDSVAPDPDPGTAVCPPSSGGWPGQEGPPPYGQAPGAAPAGHPGGAIPPTNDSMAVASLVCSLVGIVVGLGAILGIIFGFVARGRIRAGAGATKGSGLALAGIIIGIVALIANVAIASLVLTHRNSSAPPSATSVLAGNPTAADATLAQSEALPASAYPSGFTAQGPSSTDPTGGFYSGYDDSQVRALAACIGTSTANVDTNPAQSVGQKYQDGNGDNIAENIEVYPTTDNAVADVTALANPRAATCWLRFNSDLGTAIAKGVGHGTTVGTTTANAITVPALGDHAAGVQMVVPLTINGVPVTVYLDLVAIQKGRSEAILLLVGGGAASDAQGVATLEQAAAARLTT